MGSPFSFSKPRLRAAARAAAPAIGACALSTATAVTLLSATGQDDTHITYWAARALAEHGVIVNHAGARVEQSSSLLLTLVLALL